MASYYMVRRVSIRLAKSSGKRVMRWHNERYNSSFMQGTVKHDKKINFWGCFAHHGVGRLYRIEGIMDQKVYKNILICQYEPGMQALFSNGGSIFQQDNDPNEPKICKLTYRLNNGKFWIGRLNRQTLTQ